MASEGTEPVSEAMRRKIIRVAEHEAWPQLTGAQHNPGVLRVRSKLKNADRKSGVVKSPGC